MQIDVRAGCLPQSWEIITEDETTTYNHQSQRSPSPPHSPLEFHGLCEDLSRLQPSGGAGPGERHAPPTVSSPCPVRGSSCMKCRGQNAAHGATWNVIPTRSLPSAGFEFRLL